MPRDTEVEYEKIISTYDDAVDEADAQLLRMGLHQAERPTNSKGDMADLPTMPEDISDLNSRELSSLLGRLTAWFGYALGCQADAQARRNCTEEQQKAAWAKIRRLKEGTVQDKDDAVRTDSRFVSVNAALARDESLLAKIRVIVESLKRAIESVSRAMTAMEARINTEGRGVTAARRQGAAAFGAGQRSALDPFRKKRP